VAALILDENPALSPAHVSSVLQSTAIDIESSGVDTLSGYGLIDARDAVAEASSIDLIAPTWPPGSAVTITNVTDTGGSASWNAASDNHAVTGYRVYLNGSLWTTTANTSVDFTGLVAGTTYSVRVEAVDGAGNESTTGPVASLATTDTQAPTWPPGSAVTVSAVTAISATASWTSAQDNSGAVSYRVYLNDALQGSVSSLSFALTGLSSATTYTVRVEAIDGTGNESTTGPSVVFTTEADAPPTWPPGSAVTVTAITATTATASWGAASDDKSVASYEVYLNGVLQGSSTSLSLGLTGLSPETTYTVLVKAVDSGGNTTAGPSTAFTTRSPLPPGGSFTDDDGNVHEANIEAIAAAGITLGCNPPVNDRYCPNKSVTRGQMAAFLVRALGLTDDGGGNSFVDDDGSVFETDIAKLVAAGITLGCNPPANDRYCPNKSVTRGQMASFLARALGLNPIIPPQVEAFGDGVWLVPNEVVPGTYRNSDSSGACYWARLSGFSGELADIISNEFTYEIDIVTIASGDAGFESIDCGTWSTDLSPRTSSPTATFGGGTFQVGSEVAAGTWRNSDSSDDCYWERLSGFGGSLSDIISNGFSSSIQTVTVSSTDVGFSSERCGTWSKIG
jgi:chitodextrinase